MGYWKWLLKGFKNIPTLFVWVFKGFVSDITESSIGLCGFIFTPLIVFTSIPHYSLSLLYIMIPSFFMATHGMYRIHLYIQEHDND